MAIEEDVIKFLTTNKAIQRINFAWKKKAKYKVYPSAYSRDVAEALKDGNLLIRTQQKLPSGAVARYSELIDRLDFGYGFDIKSHHTQSDIVHECTHAHLDIQSLGVLPSVDGEVMAYIATAVFLEALGKKARDPSKPFIKASHKIAQRILKGTYWLSNDDVSELLVELQKVPQYSNKMIISNGFNRNFGEKIWRRLM